MTEQEVLSIQTILLSKFPYYQELSSTELKEKFEKRVSKFINRKEFDGRGIEITEEIKVLIAATAVQLTFGMNKYLFKHFDRIIIYPDKFYSPFSKSKNVGEVNTAGIIVLSWKAFKDGMKEHEDGFNVALHEMAHALNLTDLMGKDIDDLFSQYFDKWYVVARKILKNPQAEERKFLRTYAGKNLQEFFAVGVEYFFEQSEDFKKECPELYKHFSYLLNQDPTEADNLLRWEKSLDAETVLSKVEKPIKTLSLNSMRFLYPLLVIAEVIFLIFIFSVADLPIGFKIILPLVCFLFLFTAFVPSEITVYPKFIIFKYPVTFIRKSKVYSLENILSLNYTYGEKNKTFITITIYDKGEIITDKINVSTSFAGFFPFFKYMFEVNNVAIKEEYKIFIPDKQPAEKKKAWWERWSFN